MAKYDKETKFYWLQLKEDFFEDDAIEWLEEQQPNGRDYAYFYLKLCLKSLKSNGILIRNVGNILIPYDNKKLAELTKIEFDTVCVAMELLKRIGLIKILENGEIYMTQLENLIGSVSKGALKKQQQRALKNVENIIEIEEGGHLSAEVSTKDKDKVKDKTKDKDKDRVRVNSDTTPITLNELIEYGKTINASEQYCEKFYNTYESTNWINKNGQKITNAKSLLKKWINEDKNKLNNPEWFNKDIDQNITTLEEQQNFEEKLESLRKGSI